MGRSVTKFVLCVMAMLFAFSFCAVPAVSVYAEEGSSSEGVDEGGAGEGGSDEGGSSDSGEGSSEIGGGDYGDNGDDELDEQTSGERGEFQDGNGKWSGEMPDREIKRTEEATENNSSNAGATNTTITVRRVTTATTNEVAEETEDAAEEAVKEEAAEVAPEEEIEVASAGEVASVLDEEIIVDGGVFSVKAATGALMAGAAVVGGTATFMMYEGATVEKIRK